VICIFRQLNYMGLFAAQSKYLKHFPPHKKRSYTKVIVMVGWQVH